MKKHNKTKWLDMGPIIVHFGFCGSEKAYRKTMKRMGVSDTMPFVSPGAGASVRTFERPGSNMTILMCYDATAKTDNTRNQIDSLIAHEAAHVAQYSIEYMNEKGDAKETFAYIVQYVFGFVTNELWGDSCTD